MEGPIIKAPCQNTGTHIVMGAGYYVDIVHPAGMDGLSEDDITQQIIDELTVGVGGKQSAGM